jgi:hypothetical protein
VGPPKRASRPPKHRRIRLPPSPNRVPPPKRSPRRSPRSASVNPARRSTMKDRLRATDEEDPQAPSRGAPAAPKAVAAGVVLGRDAGVNEQALRTRALRKLRAGPPALPNKRTNRIPGAFRRAHRRRPPPRVKPRPRRARHHPPPRRPPRHPRVRLRRMRLWQLHPLLRPALRRASRPPRRHTQKRPRPPAHRRRTPVVDCVTPRAPACATRAPAFGVRTSSFPSHQRRGSRRRPRARRGPHMVHRRAKGRGIDVRARTARHW